MLSKGYELGGDERLQEDDKKKKGDLKEMFAVGPHNPASGMPPSV